jgi:hypothetical protein
MPDKSNIHNIDHGSLYEKWRLQNLEDERLNS